jgi:hypothetical protein
MNLYFVRRLDAGGYDTYDSFVCAAPTVQAAERTHPRESWSWNEDKQCFIDSDGDDDDFTWVGVRNVHATLIGVALGNKAGVICASFNAG